MDQIVIPPDAVAPEDPAYIQAMVDKADGKQAEPAAPALLAGKYKTQEELEKGILELVKKQHVEPSALEAYYKSLESSIGKPADKKAETPAEKPNEPVKTDDLKVPEPPKGMDLTAFEQEFAKEGTLSEESYTKLQGMGFSKATVEAYIAGQKALATQYADTVFSKAGGQEQYTQMVEWAAKNLDQAEINLFNESIESRDTVRASLMVEALHSRYINAVGRPANLIAGQSSAAGATSGYASRAEMVRDMSDPRYDKDDAYRAAVIKRLEFTTLF